VLARSILGMRGRPSGSTSPPASVRLQHRQVGIDTASDEPPHERAQEGGSRFSGSGWRSNGRDWGTGFWDGSRGLFKRRRGARRRRVVSRSFGRRIAGARVLRARSPCAATPRHGSGRRSAPSGADGGSRRRRTRSAPSSPRPPSVRPRCQAAYSSQECVFRNAFCSRARGCTSCQRERSTYWRASISRFACLTASRLSV
jgi:hypothetical protein